MRLRKGAWAPPRTETRKKCPRSTPRTFRSLLMTNMTVVSRKVNGRLYPRDSTVTKKFTVWSLVLFTSRSDGPVPDYRQVNSVFTNIMFVALHLVSLAPQVSRQALTAIIVISVERLLMLLA